MFNDTQKKRLLKVARDTIAEYAKTKKILDVKESDPLLNESLGAFVTLHKNKKLRGCIGMTIGRGPLCLTIRNMAIAAAFEDTRFMPVTEEEVDDIDIEISVLSKMKLINDPEEIVMGKHGVLVKSGFRSGLFLPQVAAEFAYSKEEFLSVLCAEKAGLPSDAWKKEGIEIYIFTAEIFKE